MPDPWARICIACAIVLLCSRKTEMSSHISRFGLRPLHHTGDDTGHLKHSSLAFQATERPPRKSAMRRSAQALQPCVSPQRRAQPLIAALRVRPMAPLQHQCSCVDILAVFGASVLFIRVGSAIALALLNRRLNTPGPTALHNSTPQSLRTRACRQSPLAHYLQPGS